MHAVINHLPIKPDTDWAALATKIDAFNALVDHPDFRGISMIRAGDNEAILLVLFATRPALDDVSRNVAAPWFAENMKQHLAGAANRSVGEVVGGALAAKS
jgi:hypothetical protein